ncbi:zinc ribbon domain-containing protein [Wenzhouxiangella sp. XN24]|uniref:FmdB family zinc ribbon protein n=1 Tax=Wenzhouxiangella sp. XN24 TaxID=2713569 RepID=UPI0013EC8F2A|nr:zinc ribbon domain-containing protein [Wenzhouxiangella sp. XN24]
MPIYEYACAACGHQLDALQRLADAPLVDCPACGAPQLKRQMSAPSFRLKGGGWYETDFKNDKRRNIAESDSKGDGGAAAEGKGAEAKPAASGEQSSGEKGGGKSGPEAGKSSEKSGAKEGGKGSGKAGPTPAAAKKPGSDASKAGAGKAGGVA